MTRYKPNFYNVLIPVAEENEYLIYNTMTGGLDVIGWEEGRLLESQTGTEAFSLLEFPQHTDFLDIMVEKRYLTPEDVDDKEAYHDTYMEINRYRVEEESFIGLTIGTTIICNMGCPYCFEFHKPNMSLKQEDVVQAIVDYLDDMMSKAPVKKWNGLNVTWYGGEPLVNMEGVAMLSPKLAEFCERHNMSYSGSIITNGILLTKEAWQFLKDSKVTNAQITLDGAQETHDVYRPLKSKNGKNYHRILENLTLAPEGININIRVNTDRAVAATLPKLLDDMQEYGLWPQRRRQFAIDPKWLRTYEGANETELQDRFTNDEFFVALQDFRNLQIDRYNAWASTNNGELAKRRWQMPGLQIDCATWASPYSMTIDPDGNVHKCWETIHDDKDAVANVKDGWNPADYTAHINYDRRDVFSECRTCKFLPVCEGLTCSKEALDAKTLPCTEWKTNIEWVLKDQYLTYKRTPELIGPPQGVGSDLNQTHSAK